MLHPEETYADLIRQIVNPMEDCKEFYPILYPIKDLTLDTAQQLHDFGCFEVAMYRASLSEEMLDEFQTAIICHN